MKAINSLVCLLAVVPFIWAGTSRGLVQPAINVSLGNGSPVLLQSLEVTSSDSVPATSSPARINISLGLKNTGPRTIIGLTFRIDAPFLTAGHASLSMPNLEVAKDGMVSVPFKLELSRFAPQTHSDSALQISLDCVLFNDLSRYGPDTLHSHQSLGVFAAENRRERLYLQQLLRTGRVAEVREELNFGLPETPQDFRVAALPQGTSAASAQERIAVVALSVTKSPLQILSSEAYGTPDGVARSVLRIRNVSPREIAAVGLVFLVRDEHATDFVGAVLPERLDLMPGSEGRFVETEDLRFSRTSGPPMLIRGLSLCVSSIEFTDGSVWVPSREDVEQATPNPTLRRLLTDSPERQRLAGLFRREGINAVAEELRKPE